MTDIFADIAATEDDIMAGASMEDDTPSADIPKQRRTRTRDRDCEKCGEQFHGGTKLCPDCREPRTTRTPRGSSRLNDDLLEGYVSFSSEIAVVLPTVSGVLIARAESTINGLVSVSKGHPRVQALLKKAAVASQFTALLETLMLVIFAAAIDLGRIPPDHPMTEFISSVELARDEKGKPVRDEQGKYVKHRTTLREIYDTTHPHVDNSFQNNAFSGPPPPYSSNGHIPHDTGSGPTTMPPMNWTP